MRSHVVKSEQGAEVTLVLSANESTILHNALSVFVLTAVPTNEFENGQISIAQDMLSWIPYGEQFGTDNPYLTLEEQE
jgi:hypothetical protein